MRAAWVKVWEVGAQKRVPGVRQPFSISGFSFASTISQGWNRREVRLSVLFLFLFGAHFSPGLPGNQASPHFQHWESQQQPHEPPQLGAQRHQVERLVVLPQLHPLVPDQRKRKMPHLAWSDFWRYCSWNWSVGTWLRWKTRSYNWEILHIIENYVLCRTYGIFYILRLPAFTCSQSWRRQRPNRWSCSLSRRSGVSGTCGKCTVAGNGSCCRSERDGRWKNEKKNCGFTTL